MHFGHFAPVACLTLQTLLRQMVSDGLLATPLWSIALARGYTCLTFLHCAQQCPSALWSIAQAGPNVRSCTGSQSDETRNREVFTSSRTAERSLFEIQKHRNNAHMYIFIREDILERNRHIWNMVVMAETIWAPILVKCEGLKKGQSARSNSDA